MVLTKTFKDVLEFKVVVEASDLASGISITLDNDPTNSEYTDAIYNYQIVTASTNIEKTGLVSEYDDSTGVLSITDSGTKLATGDIIYGWAVLI